MLSSSILSYYGTRLIRLIACHPLHQKSNIHNQHAIHTTKVAPKWVGYKIKNANGLVQMKSRTSENNKTTTPADHRRNDERRAPHEYMNPCSPFARRGEL